MATILFYEKPGCVNNTRQKQMLTAAGHSVEAKNLLTTVWQAEQLRPFFSGLAVRDWFNYSAPAIKHGEVIPDSLNEQQALALLVSNPLLIRRPLMQIGELKLAGFDLEKLNHWLNLATSTTSEQNLENCPRSASSCSQH
jgi:nitrogenase-associated protein